MYPSCVLAMFEFVYLVCVVCTVRLLVIFFLERRTTRDPITHNDHTERLSIASRAK